MEESGLRRLTLDHNLAQLMVDEGVMTVEQVANTDYGHRLYNALGNSQERAIPDLHVIPWHDQVKLLLCSDGLSNDVSDEEIERILSSDHTTDEMCQLLIDQALLYGGKDNITVVLAGLE
jgi:serine/threonine protein phosphatase PrpC